MKAVKKLAPRQARPASVYAPAGNEVSGRVKLMGLVFGSALIDQRLPQGVSAQIRSWK